MPSADGTWDKPSSGSSSRVVPMPRHGNLTVECAVFYDSRKFDKATTDREGANRVYIATS